MERAKSIKDIIEQVGRIERTNSNWGEKARIIAQKYIYNIQLTENCKRWMTEIYGLPKKTNGEIFKRFNQRWADLSNLILDFQVPAYVYMRPTRKMWVVDGWHNYQSVYEVFKDEERARNYYTDLLVKYPNGEVNCYEVGIETIYPHNTLIGKYTFLARKLQNNELKQ